MEPIEALDKLFNYYSEREALSLQKKEALESAIPQEVKEALSDIEIEFSPLEKKVNENIALLEDSIKASTLAKKDSVKGNFLTAVFRKGKPGGYDTKKMDQYAEDHPSVKKFKKPDGKPSVIFQTNDKVESKESENE